MQRQLEWMYMCVHAKNGTNEKTVKYHNFFKFFFFFWVSRWKEVILAFNPVLLVCIFVRWWTILYLRWTAKARKNDLHLIELMQKL